MAPNYMLLAACYLCLLIATSEYLTANALADPKTFPREEMESFELRIRADPSPTINLTTMPGCVQNDCLVSDAATINCPAISVPCPTSWAKNKTCITYSQSCYCDQIMPLQCAWGCSWFNWLLAEDWFARPDVCASAPNITFSGLPECARNCMIENSFNYGCITHTKNCFCKHGSLYGCDTKCKGVSDSGPGGEVASWYAQQCNVTMKTANAALNASLYEATRPPPWKIVKGRGLRWYEIMAIAVGAATLITLGAVLLWLNNLQRGAEEKQRMKNKAKEVEKLKAGQDQQEKKKKQKKQREPPLPTTEVSGKPKGRFQRFDQGLRSKIQALVQEKETDAKEEGEKSKED